MWININTKHKRKLVDSCPRSAISKMVREKCGFFGHTTLNVLRPDGWGKINFEDVAKAIDKEHRIVIFDSQYDKRTVYMDELYHDDEIYMLGRLVGLFVCF